MQLAQAPHRTGVAECEPIRTHELASETSWPLPCARMHAVQALIA
ncbi:hypothetical protein [Dokdonella sp.]